MGSNERFMDERTSNAGFSMKSLVIFMLRDHWRRLHTPCHPRTFSLLPSSCRRRSALRGRLPIFPNCLSVQLRAHTLADAPRRGREPFGPFGYKEPHYRHPLRTFDAVTFSLSSSCRISQLGTA